MRLVFIATGDIALPAFRHLLDAGPKPLALVTQPDKPVGRHQQMQPPAIKTAAIEILQQCDWQVRRNSTLTGRRAARWFD